MSRLDDYIYKKFNRYPCVLPDHLRNYNGTGKVKLHTDWPPPLNKIPRSWNVRGPRCKGLMQCPDCPGLGYASWPPKLMRGKGVTRWETAGATSIIYIPSLEEKEIDESFYGTKILAWETKPDHPNFRKKGIVHITYKKGDQSPGTYSPSALQRWSPSGFLNLEPSYYSTWKVIKKREHPFTETEKTGENIVAFFRSGFRPDHKDIYYNDGPMTGFHMD